MMTTMLTASRTIVDPPSEFIPVAPPTRPQVRGKLLYVGDEPFFLRGVTYGTFRPDQDGREYQSPQVVERDFAAMATNGINTVRVYTVPPRWLLDIAQRHGLYVMVGFRGSSM
jgi:beta-galactosidase/beta-glucuronidase